MFKSRTRNSKRQGNFSLFFFFLFVRRMKRDIYAAAAATGPDNYCRGGIRGCTRVAPALPPFINDVEKKKKRRTGEAIYYL